MKPTRDSRFSVGRFGLLACGLALVGAASCRGSTAVPTAMSAEHIVGPVASPPESDAAPSATESAAAPSASEANTVTAAESLSAKRLLAKLRNRFEPAASGEETVLPVGPRTTFLRASRGLRPRFAAGAPSHARIIVPSRADQPFHLEDATNTFGVDVALDGARAVGGLAADGYVVYPRAHGAGETVLHRPTTDGLEDYLSFEARPATPSVTYTFTVGGATKGLRLVSNTLELVDAGGAPRLRVEPPSLVGADGARVGAQLAVAGCAVDTNPAAPWGRAVATPGATRCTLRVSWNDSDVEYPAVLDPRWTSTATTMVAKRQGHTATLLSGTGTFNGKVLVAGGTDGSTALATAELFDRTTKSWAATAPMPAGRQQHAALQLPTSSNTATSGKVLVTGGWTGVTSSSGSSLNTTALYDPAAGTWIVGAPMVNGATAVPRHLHTATLLANGQVLVAGGMNGTVVISTAGVYNPASGTGSWTATTAMSSAVRYHTATLLTGTGALNGKVLVVGGNTGGTTNIAVVQLFTFGANPSWTTTGAAQLPMGREGHTATLLANGKVLVTGGRSGANPVATTVVFNPGVSPTTWTSAGTMNATHTGHTATLLSTSVLANGQVLVAGGAPSTTSSAELWNGTSTWTATTALSSVISGHSATLLSDGTVLIAGGVTGTTSNNTAQLYDPSWALGCTSNSQCATGFCVSGVCCDTACNGGCGACNLTGKVGTCSAVASGTTCRAAVAGGCDVAEKCNGTSNACPTDVVVASGTVCRVAVPGGCDVAEKCNGTSNACPADVVVASGTVCRAAVPGGCDVAEACNGTSNACPADVVAANGTVCRAAVPGGCDVAEACNGTSNACPVDVVKAGGTVCRAAVTGGCDVAEACSGTSNACPADVVAANGTVCRAAVPGGCDVAEACNGTSNACPADVVAASGTVCRAAVPGGCDVAEVCNGTADTCPPDVVQPFGTLCRAAVGACDVAEICSGAGASCPADGFVAAGTICRESTGQCDADEACTGTSGACPPDGPKPNGTGCDDGLHCTTADVCANGVCRGAPVVCTAADQCHTAGACTESVGHCSNPAAPNGITCNDGNPATTDETCQVGQCRSPSSYPAISNLAVDDIGELGGGQSFAVSIDSFGEVVGSSAVSDGTSHAIDWQAPGPLVDITTQGGFLTGSGANVINDQAQIAGGTYTGNDFHGFFVGLDGVEDLGPLGDDSSAVDVFTYQGSDVYGMNLSGQLVGWYTKNGVIHGYRYTNGIVEDLGSLSPGGAGDETIANAISDGGTVVGSSWVPGSPHDLTARRLGHAFIWNELDATIADLNQYVDPTSGIVLHDASSISPNGRYIAGDAERNGILFAFRLDTSTLALDEVSAGWGGDAFGDGVNDSGDVVGTAYNANKTVQAAFMYTDSIGFKTLDSIISPTSGWDLRVADALNASGDVVGWGRYQNEYRGYRLHSIVSPQQACVGKAEGDPCDHGTFCPSNNVCYNGACGGADPADAVCLRADGLVDVGNGQFMAVLGYDSSDTTTVIPAIDEVKLDGLVVSNPRPMPPQWLDPLSHPGTYLPKITASQTLTWRVNGQLVTASAASLSHVLPIDGPDGPYVSFEGSQIPIPPDLSKFSLPPAQTQAQQETLYQTPFNGKVEGSLGVGPSGAATYTVPIKIPPGISGMAPNLNLVYNSQGSNGLAGQGWELTGLSAIHRCSRTRIQDGVSDPVGMYPLDQDGVCLDGKRLFTRGLGSYQLEVDDFSTITRTADAQTFIVVTKTGETRYYGLSPHARVVLPPSDVTDFSQDIAVWALDRVMDVWGNYYDIHYNNDDDGWAFDGLRVTEIDYTAHAATDVNSTDTSTFNAISFEYRINPDATQDEPRPDVRVIRFGSVTLPRPYRLSAIQTTAGRYSLTYKPDVDQMLPSLLSRIDYCASGECLEPLTFDWDAGGYAWEETPKISPWVQGVVQDNSFDLPYDISSPDWSNQLEEVGGTQFVDLDGDGRPDFVKSIIDDVTLPGGTAQVAYQNTGTGWAGKASWALPSALYSAQKGRLGTYFVDFDGDGLLDLVHDAPEQKTFSPQVFLNHLRPDLGGRWIERPGLWSLPSRWGAINFSANDGIVDMDGDGRADLVRFYPRQLITPATKTAPAVYSPAELWVALNTGSGWSDAFQYLYQLPQPDEWTSYHLEDVNRDGLPDIVGKKIVALNSALPDQNGHVWTDVSASSLIDTHTDTTPGERFVADLDGDGIYDVITAPPPKVTQTSKSNCGFAETYQVAPATIAMATGRGFIGNGTLNFENALNSFRPTAAQINGCNAEYQDYWSVADINGDGLADLVVNHPSDSTYGVGYGDGQVLINRGATFVDLNGSTGWTLSAGANPVPRVPSTVVPTPGSSVPYEDRGQVWVDLNGDGLADVVQSGDSGAFPSTAYLNKFRPPVITGFPDGLAQKASVAYTYTTSKDAQTNQTYIDDAALAPGTIYMATPMRVVSTLTHEDGRGIGVMGTTTYQYHSLRASTTRGPQGFASMVATDNLTGVTTTTTFAQAYPFTGMVTSVGRTLNGAGVGGTTTDYCYTLAAQGTSPCISYGSPDVGSNLTTRTSVVVHLNNVVDTAIAVAASGSESIMTTTKYQYDGHGNPKQVDVSTENMSDHETFEKVTNNTFGDPGSRAETLGKITQAIVTTTRTYPPDGNNIPIVHTSQFDYSEINAFVAPLRSAQTTLALMKTRREPGVGAPIEMHTAFAYDAFGNITSTTECASNFDLCDPNASTNFGFRRTKVDYDPAHFNNPSGPGLTTTPGYVQVGRFPVATTDPAGHTEYSLYDPNFGALIQKTSPNGLHTCYAYDVFGFKSDEYARCGIDNLDTKTYRRYVLDEPDHVDAKFVTITEPPVGGKTWVYTDDLGRTIFTRGRSFDGRFIESAASFDTQGRTLSETVPQIVGTSPTYQSVHYYDAFNRPSTSSQDLGRIDLAGFPTFTQTQTIYDGLTIQTDSSGPAIGTFQRHKERKNAIGKPAWVEDLAGNRVTYVYDAEGRVTDMYDPFNNDAHYEYDSLGRKTFESNADFDFKRYTYDGFGGLTSVSDGEGRATSMTYDLLGRMTTKTDSSGTAQWVYDVAPGAGIGKIAAFISAPDPRLAAPCAIPNVAYTDGNRSGRYYTYDSLGYLQEQDECIDGDVFATRYTLDSVGRPGTVQYPSIDGTSLTLRYNYNEMGFLNYVVDAADETVFWAAKSVDALGHVTDEYTRNGVETKTIRNPVAGMLLNSTSTSAGDGDRIVQNWTYGYDEAGNLKRRARADALNASGSSEDFTYDSLNRLSTSHTQVPLYGYDVTDAFDYDEIGNLTYKSGKVYTYNGCGAGPHAVCAINNVPLFAYDGSGNMTADSDRTLTYNDQNKVLSITKGTADVELIYGADGNRVVQDQGTRDDSGFTSTARTVYVGMDGAGKNLYQRTTRGSTIEHLQFLYAAGSSAPFAVRSVTTSPGTTPTTLTSYYHRDQLGSVTAMSDDQGHVSDSLEAGVGATNLGYDVWGARRNPDGRAADPASFPQLVGHREFTGHEAIPDVGLVNMNGRVYDPVLGRMLSVDIAIQDITDLQTFNLYSYVGNNPLRFNDPTGYYYHQHQKPSYVGVAVGITIGIVGAIACGFSEGLACPVMFAVMAAYWSASSVLAAGGTFDQALLVGYASLFTGLVGGVAGGIAGGAVGGVAGAFVSGAVSGGVGTALQTEMTGGTVTWKGVLEGAAESAAISGYSSAIVTTIQVSQASVAQLQGGGGSMADDLERHETIEYVLDTNDIGSWDRDSFFFGAGVEGDHTGSDPLATEDGAGAHGGGDNAPDLTPKVYGPMVDGGGPGPGASGLQYSATVHALLGLQLSCSILGDATGEEVFNAGFLVRYGWDFNLSVGASPVVYPTATVDNLTGFSPQVEAGLDLLVVSGAVGASRSGGRWYPYGTPTVPIPKVNAGLGIGGYGAGGASVGIRIPPFSGMSW